MNWSGLNRFAEQRGKCPSIAFRIKPGVDAHTHEFVSHRSN